MTAARRIAAWIASDTQGLQRIPLVRTPSYCGSLTDLESVTKPILRNPARLSSPITLITSP